MLRRTAVGALALGTLAGVALLFALESETHAQNPRGTRPKSPGKGGIAQPTAPQAFLKPVPRGYGVHWTGKTVMLKNLTTKKLVAFPPAPKALAAKFVAMRKLPRLSRARPDGPVANPNYIVYTSWMNTSTDFIKSFRTTFVVPPPPAANDNQLIFIWNGLCPPDGSHVLQPVLQWGVSQAGGGPTWNIASWYVPASGQMSPTQLVPVNPGQVLTGAITCTAFGFDAGSGTLVYDYTCEFDGFPQTRLPVSGVPQLTWALEVLEAYGSAAGGVPPCPDYPNTKTTDLTGISIQTSKTMSGTQIPWQRFAPVNGCGQGIGFDSIGSGIVTIFYPSPAGPGAPRKR